VLSGGGGGGGAVRGACWLLEPPSDTCVGKYGRTAEIPAFTANFEDILEIFSD
jgi:hypothetical protein